MTAVRRKSRQKTRRRCEIATAFVNLDDKHPQRLEAFMRKYQRDLRPPGIWGATKEDILQIAHSLREAWDKGKWDTAAENLEHILAGYPREANKAMPSSGQWPNEYTPYLRSAFQIQLGHEQPTFEPRDVLDQSAYAILRASALSLLKKCEGKKNWNCITPYLVADEGRRRYCYGTCGDEAKAEAKRNPKKGRKH